MGLAEDIMGKTEEKKSEEKSETGLKFVEVPKLDDKGNPTGQMQKVEARTGMEYHPDFDKWLGELGKPRKHPPTFQRGVVYDKDGRPIALKKS